MNTNAAQITATYVRHLLVKSSNKIQHHIYRYSLVYSAMLLVAILRLWRLKGLIPLLKTVKIPT